jgi:multidrug resistance efflux pump
MENLKKEPTNNEISKKKGISMLAGVTVLVIVLVGLFYWQATKDQIYVEKATISAPEIALSATEGGMLEGIFVKEGDIVPANTTVAQIGNETVKTATPGLVIQTKNNIGENFSPGEPVVTIINPTDLRVVAQIEEDKGLSDIVVGQQAVFTVDAFGSKKFYGTVDAVAPTSRDSGVVFSISDKREVKNFDVKIRFDEKQYAQLKNGMSAKAWVYKN